MEPLKGSDDARGRTTGERPRAIRLAAQTGVENAGDELKALEVEEEAPGVGCPIAPRRRAPSAPRRPAELRLRRSRAGGSGSTWPDKAPSTGTPWRNPA